jgi:hypothetical protein
MGGNFEIDDKLRAELKSKFPKAYEHAAKECHMSESDQLYWLWEFLRWKWIRPNMPPPYMRVDQAGVEFEELIGGYPVDPSPIPFALQRLILTTVDDVSSQGGPDGIENIMHQRWGRFTPFIRVKCIESVRIKRRTEIGRPLPPPRLAFVDCRSENQLKPSMRVALGYHVFDFVFSFEKK